MNIEIAASSRAERVAQIIEGQIRKRQSSSGEFLGTKDELQDKFGVARATLNEAIGLLKDRGYVDTRSGPGGGVFVSVPDAGVQLGRFLVSARRNVSEVADVLELREHLEILLARHAAVHASEEDLSELYVILESINNAGESLEEQLSEIWHLHDQICKISPNEALRTLYLGLVSFIQSNIEKKAPSGNEGPSFFQRRMAAHRQLVDAIASGDPDVAAEAAKAHNED